MIFINSNLCYYEFYKNSSNILLKNLLDTYVGAIVYYLVGYAIANNAQGGIIGHYHFASIGFSEDDYLKCIIQYSICSNIPTIVAGSLAERTFVDTYMFFSLLITGFVYPVAAAWIWGGGWLKVLGFRDFAGAGVVHLLGVLHSGRKPQVADRENLHHKKTDRAYQ